MNSDEKITRLFKFSSIPIVDRYFKSTNSMYHDHTYQIAIEKFAVWLCDEQTPLQKSAQKSIDIGYHGNFSAMQILAAQCTIYETGLDPIQQKAAVRAMEIFASNNLNKEQEPERCVANPMNSEQNPDKI